MLKKKLELTCGDGQEEMDGQQELDESKLPKKGDIPEQLQN